MAERKLRHIPAEFDEHRFVHESMIEICDQLGEAMASAYNPMVPSCAFDRLAEINKKVWQMRWELDMTGGDAVGLADVEERGPSGVGIPFGGVVSDA